MYKFLIVLTLFTSMSSYGQPQAVQELDRAVSRTQDPVYRGQARLTAAESELLLAQMGHQRAQQVNNDCPPEGSGQGSSTSTTSLPSTPSTPSTPDNWRVVFLARSSVRNDERTSSTSHEVQGRAGAALAASDTADLMQLARAGNLTQESLDARLASAGQSLGRNPQEAMAYVAGLGQALVSRYGDSRPGEFITAVEQYGRLGTPRANPSASVPASESVGQCSDIHYAMLRAYKRITGNPNARAYLVNFQTGRQLHHTVLVIEEAERVYVVNYGEVTSMPAGRAYVLRQNSSAGHGLAYRVFNEENERLDQMVAHIDSPLGMLLREVSTGRSSYNPLARPSYSLASLGMANQNNDQVRLFIGELGGNDMITGIAVNLSRVRQLPAGFRLEAHISSALAYTNQRFLVDARASSLTSQILYINTGLGIISPKLELGNFSLSASTRLTVEGGVWLKQYSDAMNSNYDPVEGDGNVSSRTTVSAEYNTRRLSLGVSTELEIMPSFRTAFPSVTDGSSADGFASSLGILPNRLTTSVRVNYRPSSIFDIGASAIHNYSPMGHVGEVRAGVTVRGVVRGEATVTAYLRGALDRGQTPAFVPGAIRTVGVDARYCTGVEGRSSLPICATLHFGRSLEHDEDFQFGAGLELRH
jgi:hypothetical protein